MVGLMLGAVRSTSKGPALAVALLPAWSTAVPSTVWSAPSPGEPSGPQDAMPERASEHWNETWGGPLEMLYQPDRSGSADQEMPGAVRSTSNGPTLMSAELPAASVAVRF